MTTPPEHDRAAARRWAMRTREPLFDDWDGLTAWLEEDTANAYEYDAACDDDEWVDTLFVPQPSPIATARERRPGLLRRARWPAAAAVALGTAGLSGWYAVDRTPVRNYATVDGERRTLVLGAGTRIAMNGSTRLTVRGPRQVTLDRGQALFEVRHDAADPFVLTIGQTRLVDAGTVFDVSADDARLTVGVSKGRVLYRTEDREVMLVAGQSLTRAAKAGVTIRRVDPDMIGTWHLGYLAYADTTLGQVAVDLSRNLGHPITVGGTDARQRFSGTLRIDGDADAVLASAGPLLGVRFAKQGSGWTMTSASGVR